MSNLITSAVMIILSFIAGSVMYEMYEATKFVLIISSVSTIIIMMLAILAHRSRKSYIRFTGIEMIFMFNGIFLMLTIAQDVAILTLN